MKSTHEPAYHLIHFAGKHLWVSHTPPQAEEIGYFYIEVVTGTRQPSSGQKLVEAIAKKGIEEGLKIVAKKMGG